MSGANSIDFDALFAGSDDLAEEIGNLWSEWDGARSGVKKRWEEVTQFVFATSTRETMNGSAGGLYDDETYTGDEESEGGGFDHSTHIPKLCEIFDNLTATYMRATMPHENFFTYRAFDANAAKKEVRLLVESYLKSKHRANNLRGIYQQVIDDLCLYGNCFVYVDFINEQVNANVGNEIHHEAYVGPKPRRISPYDIVFNPLAADFESSPRIVRTLKTIGELHRDIEDSSDSELAKEILQKALDSRERIKQINHEDFDKHSQLTFDGYGTPSQYFKSGYVEILTLYGDIYDYSTKTFYKNHAVVVIDRKYVLRKQELQTYSGRPLLFHAAWRNRPDNLWGMGPLDNLVGMQYMVNHLENARADAFDQMLVPTRIEIGDVDNQGAESGRPGGKYVIPSGEGDVRNLAPDTTVLNADFQIDRKLSQMERLSGLPAEQAGFRTPGEKTYGEVALLDRNASKVFKNKIIQLEHMLEKVLNAELELAKSNPNMNDLIDVVGEDGVVEFLNITRADLMSNGKLVPMGARFYERRQQLVQNWQLMQQGLASDQLSLQHVSSVGTARLYEELMDMQEAKLVQPYVRVGEEMQLARLQQAAATQLQSEDQVDIGGTTFGPEE